MHRSFKWTVFLIAAVILAPFAGQLAAPADHASASAQTPTRDDEIIFLASDGQIRVDDPYTPAGYRPATWDSGAEIGWDLVAAGDFNGDGDAEIVATDGDVVKVFDPIVQAGYQPVVFERSLGYGRTIRLLVVGDFDSDGKDEIALTHLDFGTNTLEMLKVYDGGSDGTAAQWTLINSQSYNALWQDMTVGDINADGADDISLVRNIMDGWKQVIVYNGRTWAILGQGDYNFNWLALAAGNLTSDYAGDELALTRGDVLGERESVIVLRLEGSAFAALPSLDYKFYPYFTSLAVGDLNGDGDDEILMLRDPAQPSAALIMRNPAGAVMRAFEQAIGYGSTAWKLVRTGDVDGDGRDEIVVERGDVYRIYTAPDVNDFYTDKTGSYLTAAMPSNIPTLAVANIDGLGVLLGPVLSVTPASQSFDLEYGQASTTKSFAITNTGTTDIVSWQAQVVEGAAWLQLAQTSGVTPGALGVSVNTTAVIPGSYSGRIRITATSGGTVSGSPQDVTVSLTLRGVAMVVSPLSLSFDVKYGQTSPIKPVTISSAGGSSPIQWQADVLEGASWLILSASQGTSPATVNVSVNTLAVTPGTQTGTIRIRALNSQVSQGTQYIAVTLTVQDSGLVVTPEQLVFWQKAGKPAQTRTISIVRPGWAVQWIATALPTANAAALLDQLANGEVEVTAAGLMLDGEAVPAPTWLSITPDQGTTPATMSVSIQTAVPGTYRAMIVIVAVDPTVPNRVHTVDVTATVVGDFSYVPLLLK